MPPSTLNLRKAEKDFSDWEVTIGRGSKHGLEDQGFLRMHVGNKERSESVFTSYMTYVKFTVYQGYQCFPRYSSLQVGGRQNRIFGLEKTTHQNHSLYYRKEIYPWRWLHILGSCSQTNTYWTPATWRWLLWGFRGKKAKAEVVTVLDKLSPQVGSQKRGPGMTGRHLWSNMQINRWR